MIGDSGFVGDRGTVLTGDPETDRGAILTGEPDAILTGDPDADRGTILTGDPDVDRNIFTGDPDFVGDPPFVGDPLGVLTLDPADAEFALCRVAGRLLLGVPFINLSSVDRRISARSDSVVLWRSLGSGAGRGP